MRHPRLIPVLLLIIITSLATPLQAQIVLKGKITTEKNEPVAFAPVILQQLPDTTRYTEGVITDMAGNYRFGKHRAGRYLLSVRTIGYKTLYDTVLLRKPSIGMTEVVRDYVLSEDVAEIDAVVVTANNTASYFDRTVYTITNEDRKAAVTSLDLTNKIPHAGVCRPQYFMERRRSCGETMELPACKAVGAYHSQRDTARPVRCPCPGVLPATVCFQRHDC